MFSPATGKKPRRDESGARKMAAVRDEEPSLDRRLLVSVLDADVMSVRSLISAGADINFCVPVSNRAALYMPAGSGNRTPIGVAISERANHAIYLNLSDSAGSDAKNREQEARKQREQLLEILEELARAGADVNLSSTSSVAQPPIFIAARNGDSEAVELLLRYGARTEETGALHAAAIEGHIETVKLLLASGMDRNDKLSGLTALQMLQERAKTPETQPEWELNLGEEYEQQEAEREKQRATRRLQIMNMLEARN